MSIFIYAYMYTLLYTLSYLYSCYINIILIYKIHKHSDNIFLKMSLIPKEAELLLDLEAQLIICLEFV